MRILTKFSLGLIAAFAYSTALVQPVLAHDLDLVLQARGGNPGADGGRGGGNKDDESDGSGSTREPNP